MNYDINTPAVHVKWNQTPKGDTVTIRCIDIPASEFTEEQCMALIASTPYDGDVFYFDYRAGVSMSAQHREDRPDIFVVEWTMHERGVDAAWDKELDSMFVKKIEEQLDTEMRDEICQAIRRQWKYEACQP